MGSENYITHFFSVNVMSLTLLEMSKVPVCLSDCQTEELVVSPATDEAQKAFSDLTTVALLQQALK